jgi:hypothetical protein
MCEGWNNNFFNLVNVHNVNCLLSTNIGDLSLMFHPTPHTYSAMVFWPVVKSLHRFCKRSWSWTFVHHYIVMIWYISYVIWYMTYKCSNHWHRFCKRSWSWTFLCWVRLPGGLPTASCWIIVRTVASSFWHHSMTRHIDGWACPTRIQQDAVGNPPGKRTQQRNVQLQERLQNLCRDLTTGQKTIA